MLENLYDIPDFIEPHKSSKTFQLKREILYDGKGAKIEFKIYESCLQNLFISIIFEAEAVGHPFKGYVGYVHHTVHMYTRCMW